MGFMYFSFVEMMTHYVLLTLASFSEANILGEQRRTILESVGQNDWFQLEKITTNYLDAEQ